MVPGLARRAGARQHAGPADGRSPASSSACSSRSAIGSIVVPAGPSSFRPADDRPRSWSLSRPRRLDRWMLAMPFVVAYAAIWAGLRFPLASRRRDLSYGTYIYAFPIGLAVAAAGGARAGIVPFILATLALTISRRRSPAGCSSNSPLSRSRTACRSRAAVPRASAVRWPRERGRCRLGGRSRCRRRLPPDGPLEPAARGSSRPADRRPRRFIGRPGTRVVLDPGMRNSARCDIPDSSSRSSSCPAPPGSCTRSSGRASSSSSSATRPRPSRRS